MREEFIKPQPLKTAPEEARELRRKALVELSREGALWSPPTSHAFAPRPAAWRATGHGAAESDTTERLSTAQHHRPRIQTVLGRRVLGQRPLCGASRKWLGRAARISRKGMPAAIFESPTGTSAPLDCVVRLSHSGHQLGEGGDVPAM